MDNDLLYMRVAARVFGQPLLIRPQEAEIIGAYVRSRMEGVKPEASRFVGEQQIDAAGRWRGYRKVGSVGVISILGELVNRGAWLGASSGLTSYEGIVEQVRQASEDRDVETIVLDINSPGGEALGMADTARAIRRLAAGRRIVAVTNSLAASAAYGLATSGDEIVITESGVAGSIGVVMVHYDHSQRLENMGVRATVITKGKLKAVGHPFGALSEDDLQELDRQASRFMDGFVRLVADHRPDLSEDRIRALEAGIKIGQDAVDAGLADRVGTFESVIDELTRARSGRFPSQSRRYSMSEKTGSPAADTSAGIPLAEHEAALGRARTEARAAGAAEATQRLGAVLSADGIKGDGRRMAAALDLAVKSPGMSAEDVVSFVTGNVAAGTQPEPQAQADAYEASRTAAAGLVSPAKADARRTKSDLSAGSIYAARRNAKGA